MRTVLRITGLGDYVQPVQMNASKKSPNQTLAYWYRQLDNKTLAEFVDLYRYDFEVFGYDKTPPV